MYINIYREHKNEHSHVKQQQQQTVSKNSEGGPDAHSVHDLLLLLTTIKLLASCV